MFCLKCGKEIKDGAKFCPHCGAVTSAGGTADNAAPSGPESSAYTAPESQAAGGGISSVVGGIKRRGGLLVIGGIAAAAVLVIVVIAAIVGGLFASPKGKVEKALGKTISAYADVANKAGVPDLGKLVKSGSYSQRVSVAVGSVSSDASYYYDMSALKGLGVRASTDYDQKGKKMDADMTLFLDDEDLMSFQVLVDNDKVLFSSREFTKGTAYGLNTTTVGKDLDKLGAYNDDIDVKKISFNIFDLIEKATPTDAQTKEMEKAVSEANKQLLKAIEVEKDGKKSVQVNGKSVNADLYHVTVSKDAMKDYINAMKDAMKTVDTKAMMKDVLQSMGFDKSTVNEIVSRMGDTDVYGDLADDLKDMVKTIGDVELDVYLNGGYVCAVEYSDRIDGSRVQFELYLGGGDNYVDDLSMELSVDSNKLTVESTGNHAGKGGVFTDETTIKGGSDRISSELRYEPKASNGNFEWEMRVNNTASVAMEGQLTTTKDSIDLHLDDLSVRAAGSKLFSLEAEYYMGPCKGMQVSISSQKLLSDMDEDDLEDLVDDIRDNAEDWAYDMEDKLPSYLRYYLPSYLRYYLF